jgi:hypothetical protein
MSGVAGLVLGTLVVVALLVVLGVLVARQRDAVEAAYQQVCRDHRLRPTDTPLGTSDGQLAQFELLPRGDRDHSAVWGMEGPAEVDLGGTTVPATCAAFEWWWEDRQTSTDSKGHTKTTWKRRSCLAALVRLPAPYVMPRVRVEDEGMLARFGIGGRGDLQVESEEFNRRYDVRATDRTAAIRLLDADFQHQMLGTFDGTAFELAGDLALVVVDAPLSTSFSVGGITRRGGPGGLAGLLSREGDRIRTNPAIVQALPGMRHRAVALLQAMPAGWWRGLAHRAGEVGT